jgi:hypothetical protein
LRRLIAQKIWISAAAKTVLSEADAQLTELNGLLAQLENDVQAQLNRA